MAAQSVGPAISTGSVAITGTSAADPLQSIITKDGLSVSLDDYVYMTPDDPTEPFFIGRVMAFLPPAKPGYPEQVRVGWFYRPRDVLGGRRKHYDLRLLLASMHSDVNSSSCIRGKCHVRHSHQIPDLVGYKSHEDHFYYNQLFDRYTHRLFDVVPIEIARNLPKPVLEALSGHDFIVVEAGRAADYTDARNCSICEGLCASDESIKCGGCESIFHLPCVYLSRKPTKGYVWECIDCQRKALQQSTGLATPNLRSSTPSSLMSSVSVSPTQRARPSTPEHVPVPLGQKRLWPFRYYDDKVTLSDLRDPLDEGCPRASSRIGKQFQADVPELPDTLKGMFPPVLPGFSKPSSPPPIDDRVGKVGRPPRRKRSQQPSGSARIRNGGELTFVLPSQMNTTVVDDFLSEVRALEVEPSIGVYDLMDKALHFLREKRFVADEALNSFSEWLKSHHRASFWSEKEVDDFENSIRKHGHDLHMAHRAVKTRSPSEVVSFFYKWKKTKRYVPVYSEYCKLYRQNKRLKDPLTFIRPPAPQDADNDDESEVSDLEVRDADFEHHPGDGNPLNRECQNCGVTESSRWRWIFERQSDGSRSALAGTGVLLTCSISVGMDRRKRMCFCQECSWYWLRYGDARPVVAQKKLPMKEKPTGGMKRKRGDTASSIASTQPVGEVTAKEHKKRGPKPKALRDEVIEPPRIPICAVCLELDGQFSQCTSCGSHVHPGCFGLPVDSFVHLCSRCRNVRDGISSLDYACVLCAKSAQANEFSGSGMKQTIGGNWAHISCSLWIPEVHFASEAMEPIVGIGSIDKRRWSSTCAVCRNRKGATIFCAHEKCSASFHVTCGFEEKFDMIIAEVPSTAGLVLEAYAFCSKHKHFPLRSSSSEQEKPLGKAVVPVEDSKELAADFECLSQTHLTSTTTSNILGKALRISFGEISSAQSLDSHAPSTASTSASISTTSSNASSPASSRSPVSTKAPGITKRNSYSNPSETANRATQWGKAEILRKFVLERKLSRSLQRGDERLTPSENFAKSMGLNASCACHLDKTDSGTDSGACSTRKAFPGTTAGTLQYFQYRQCFLCSSRNSPAWWLARRVKEGNGLVGAELVLSRTGEHVCLTSANQSFVDLSVIAYDGDSSSTATGLSIETADEPSVRVCHFCFFSKRRSFVPLERGAETIDN